MTKTRPTLHFFGTAEELYAAFQGDWVFEHNVHRLKYEGKNLITWHPTTGSFLFQGSQHVSDSLYDVIDAKFYQNVTLPTERKTSLKALVDEEKITTPVQANNGFKCHLNRSRDFSAEQPTHIFYGTFIELKIEVQSLITFGEWVDVDSNPRLTFGGTTYLTWYPTKTGTIVFQGKPHLAKEFWKRFERKVLSQEKYRYRTKSDLESNQPKGPINTLDYLLEEQEEVQ